MTRNTFSNLDRFAIPESPPDWREFNLEQKKRWLMNHTRPTCSYSEACGILARRGATARAARKKRREYARRYRENDPVSQCAESVAARKPSQPRGV